MTVRAESKYWVVKGPVTPLSVPQVDLVNLSEFFVLKGPYTYLRSALRDDAILNGDDDRRNPLRNI